MQATTLLAIPLSSTPKQAPFKIVRSISKAGKIIKDFRPDVAVGVGGYASAPLLWSAQRHGVPTLIQEQNGFAGLTNKILGKKADFICVAYEGMERFFPADRIVMTGNPIRKGIVPATEEMRKEGMAFYGLDPGRRHILIVGGSLGSGTLNRSVMKWIDRGCPGGENVELIWQCGKYYKPQVEAFMANAEEKCGKLAGQIHWNDFISRMDLAYAVSDLVISRSGASTVSELCAVGKAALFVPSPNVAEDHQTHNAMALVRKDAAALVKDADAPEVLMSKALELVSDSAAIARMEENISALALPDAAFRIAEKIYELVDRRNQNG